MAQSHKSLASVFANEAVTYTKVVAGFTIPVRAAFKEGDTLTALQARALSTYMLDRAGSVANSNIDRGSWKDLSDADKLAKASAYLGTDYKFSDDIGGDIFGISLLQKAATNVLAKLNGEKLAGMDDNAIAKALEKHVAAFLNSPDAVEKYEDQVRSEMATILATRHAKRERKAADKSEVEISF